MGFLGDLIAISDSRVLDSLLLALSLSVSPPPILGSTLFFPRKMMMMFEEMGFCNDLDTMSTVLGDEDISAQQTDPEAIVEDDFSDEEIGSKSKEGIDAVKQTQSQEQARISSDNLHEWWKDKVRFDRNGPTAIAKYQADHSIPCKRGDPPPILKNATPNQGLPWTSRQLTCPLHHRATMLLHNSPGRRKPNTVAPPMTAKPCLPTSATFNRNPALDLHIATQEQARRKKISRAQDGILKYMLKMMEVCKAQGFVYGIIPEKGKLVTGASDNLREGEKLCQITLPNCI
ncbi:hypothetical protein V8G54_004028 [Vigna mungo]|uniref:Ethylene insensitive 3-like DNA-binding domain-containing protein n=1 Tax=Vigna mungo TaxID=3915 RepID=A0AAQ3PE47_VIGMU